jgi:transmembrane sensor
MDLHKLNNLLDRYFKGNANETEKALVDAWYKSYQAEEPKISLGDTERERVRTALQKRIREATARKPGKSTPIILYRMAAGLVLFCAVGLFYYAWQSSARNASVENYFSVTTQTGVVRKIVLPDSSIAWLNAASHLRIQSSFDGSSREVFLEEGEAFFEIRKNPEKPFIVHAAGMDIRVLGTSFNVRSYQAAPEVSVSVSTGRVSVSKEREQLAVLIPDQQLKYDRLTGKHSRATVDAAHARAWKDGNTYLHQASFAELALVLKNTYGLVVRAGDPAIQDHQFTLRLRRDVAVDQLLNLITSIHNTHYRKEGNEVVFF